MTPRMPIVKSLLIGASGGLVFHLAGMPLAWMLGPLVANLIAAISGVQIAIPERFRSGFLGTLGLLLGGQVTPALSDRIIEWPLSSVLLLSGMLVSTLATWLWYRHACHMQRISAWLASTPGAMNAIMALASGSGVEASRIAIAQGARVVLVVLLLPALFWVLNGDVEDSRILEAPLPPSSLWLLLTLPLIIPLSRYLRLPSADLLGPLLVASTLGLADIAHLVLPEWGLDLLLIVLGSSIGARFVGVHWRQLATYATQACVGTAITLAILALFAWLIHQSVDVSFSVALLSVAPGGIGEMAIIAVALGMDPIFVTFHHLLRLVTLMIITPLWIQWVSNRTQ